MLIRNLIKKCILPSERKVEDYLDVILSASNWSEQYKAACAHAGMVTRSRLHAAIWSSERLSKRVIKYLATYDQDGTFYGRNKGALEATVLFFMGCGEELTANQAEAASRFSGMMLYSIVNQYPDLPDEVLTILPKIANVASIYMDIPEKMLDRVAAQHPLYPGALYTAYLAMRGVNGNRGHAAIESLRPYLLKSLPVGVIDACLLLDDEPDTVFLQIIDQLIQPTSTEAQSLPKELSF